MTHDNLTTYAPGPRGITVGTIVDSTPPRVVTGIASPVYPKGSPADVQQRLGAARGDGSFRYLLTDADGNESSSLWHRGNAVCVRRSL